MKTNLPKIVAFYPVFQSESKSMFKYLDDNCTLETILTRPDRTFSMERQRTRLYNPDGYSYEWKPCVSTLNHKMKTMFLDNNMKIEVHTNEECDNLFLFKIMTEEEIELIRMLYAQEHPVIHV